MKNLSLSLLLVAVFFINAIAQSDFTEKEVKDMQKANKLYEKKKYDESIKLLEPIVLDHKKDKRLWTNLCRIYSDRYAAAKPNFTITTESKDKASQKLIEDLMAVMTGFKEKRDYINIMRKATLMCSELEEVGMVLRIEVIDSRYKVDTNISVKGKKYFSTAEKYFAQRDLVNAIKYYKKALDTDPDYYKAYLYLGDAYYLNKEYEEAESIFQECSDSFPDLVEPIKYYYDAMFKQSDYKKAYDLALRALLVYPDIGMQIKFGDVCKQLEKTYKQHWSSRNYFPNKVEGKNKAVNTSPWSYYREAMDSVIQYADTLTGVLAKNPVTKIRYLEEYCWSYMLDRADKSKFEFARQMREKGMLDCFVLFSMFHVDIYDQYHDLVKTNPGKLKKYIEEELVSK